MRKTTKQLALIGVILFAMYNLILFALCGFADHKAPFWISYVFVLIAFGAVAFSVVKLGRSTTVLRDWLFGYPIMYHCAIYIALELIASILFMALEEKVGWAVPFVIQLLLLGVYGILVITCFVSKTAISQVHEKVEKKTQYIGLLRADAELLCQKCSDPELKKQCQKLAEAIRFSDPMSNELLSALEQELCATVAECSRALDENNYVLASNLCNKAMLQLSERNMKCKVLK